MMMSFVCDSTSLSRIVRSVFKLWIRPQRNVFRTISGWNSESDVCQLCRSPSLLLLDTSVSLAPSCHDLWYRLLLPVHTQNDRQTCSNKDSRNMIAYPVHSGPKTGSRCRPLVGLEKFIKFWECVGDTSPVFHLSIARFIPKIDIRACSSHVAIKPAVFGPHSLGK